MTQLNELTQSEVAILSLLSEGEQHGYGLNETIEQRGFRNWTNIGFSSIYWILNRMEKSKLITSRKDPSKKGPNRKLYRLTPKGRSALLDSIRSSISIPEHQRTRVDLGAAYVELLPRKYCRSVSKVSLQYARHKNHSPLVLKSSSTMVPSKGKRNSSGWTAYSND
jgi:DNA-binding PadR family transcriptional regulator